MKDNNGLAPLTNSVKEVSNLLRETIEVKWHSFKGRNSAIFIFASLPNGVNS